VNHLAPFSPLWATLHRHLPVQDGIRLVGLTPEVSLGHPSAERPDVPSASGGSIADSIGGEAGERRFLAGRHFADARPAGGDADGGAGPRTDEWKPRSDLTDEGLD
jgi:hypothetical protein